MSENRLICRRPPPTLTMLRKLCPGHPMRPYFHELKIEAVVLTEHTHSKTQAVSQMKKNNFKKKKKTNQRIRSQIRSDNQSRLKSLSIPDR